MEQGRSTIATPLDDPLSGFNVCLGTLAGFGWYSISNFDSKSGARLEHSWADTNRLWNFGSSGEPWRLGGDVDRDLDVAAGLYNLEGP